MAAILAARSALPDLARVDDVVDLRLGSPEATTAAVERLERAVAQERRFGLLIEGCADLHHLQRLLRQAPGGRARLRRMRPALGTWCVGAAHVVEDASDFVWPAEVSWGCRAIAVQRREEALAWLAERRRA